LDGRAAAFSNELFLYYGGAQVFCVRAEWVRLGPDRHQLVRTTLDLLFELQKTDFLRYEEKEEASDCHSGVRSSAKFNFASFSLALPLRALFCHCVVCLLAWPRNKLKYISRRRAETKKLSSLGKRADVLIEIGIVCQHTS
jgi:hypothetical protein